MSKLAKLMASLVEADVDREIASLSADKKEFRAVFSGPPPELLRQVFDELASDGRLLRATAADGSPIEFPVVLQVDEIPHGLLEATARRSGALRFQSLANFRNARDTGVFLTLVPPAGQASETHDSTRKSFGVNPSATDSRAPVAEWWKDPFIQQLVERSLEGASTADEEEAARLVWLAIEAADAAGQHQVGRPGAWRVLERMWELKGGSRGFDDRVSLATGYPPNASGQIDADAKRSVLAALVDKLEEYNFGGCIAYLKERAGPDATHAEQCVRHIRSRCDVVTALRRSIATFYAPDAAEPPEWWRALTVERWLAILDEGNIETRPAGAVALSCSNPLISHLKGFVPVVRAAASIRIELPEDFVGEKVRVIRESGGAAGRREWTLEASRVIELEDDSIPEHRAPVRYTAEVPDSELRKATLRLISLSAWAPGVIVCSRTATKGSPAKAATGQIAFETSLTMTGHGRHYLDVYLRPGVVLSTDQATGSDEQGFLNPRNIVRLSEVADGEYGMEVEASGECFYQFPIVRPGKTSPEQFRVMLLAEEASPEECSSYFELMLLRNSGDGGRAPRSVHVNGQLRCSQLQAWMLEKEVAARSYYPAVLAVDYANHWRARKWESSADTIFSGGAFLNDPRPTFEEMVPPADFVEARCKIAERIRGADQNELVEAASLGEWIAGDKEFSTLVDTYVRSYSGWLQASPNEAAWCDVSLVARFEPDGVTLLQEPDAIVLSPLHPLRFAWQCVAQRAMYFAQRKLPCPAASILDPDCIPDSISLPLRTATGAIRPVLFFSVECSSDYWGIMWNAGRLDLLASQAAIAPLDREMGLLVGGISSGFSASQVHRAMDDVCSMLVAKPAVAVTISSASGQNNACNEGVLSWARKNFASGAATAKVALQGTAEIHVYDERKPEARPNDADIANLAEDTDNAVQWYLAGPSQPAADLAVIAQLETSNATALDTKLSSALSFGGLVRCRIREQLGAAAGQLLCESRMAAPTPPSGDGLADILASTISSLENLGSRQGYVFAPSMHVVKNALAKAEFAAVSSSAVDPACFLGSWLEGTYLWDYELPSYSGRSGDSNGYYLLSQIKKLDLETLQIVLSRLPGCEQLPEPALAKVVQEVARRGIPTVRGLSAGNSGATGDLGLLVAGRVLQGAFDGREAGILAAWIEDGQSTQISLVIPVDPFRRYLDDLARASRKASLQRPDLLVAVIEISGAGVRCRLTPVEVKNRTGTGAMPAQARSEALAQAKSLSVLLNGISQTFSEDAEMVLWRLAYQNLLVAMLGYGFRVYSQQLAVVGRASAWSALQSRVMTAIYGSEMDVDVDRSGRLFVIDGSPSTGAKDVDGDGFKETIELSRSDAGRVLRGEAADLLASIRDRLGDWGFAPVAPSGTLEGRTPGETAGTQPTIPGATTNPAPVEGYAKHQGSNGPSEAPSDGQAAPDLPDENASKVLDSPAARSELVEQEGLILHVGESVDDFEPATRRLNLGDTALNQLNMGVVGDLGTGKTQLLKSLIYQISGGSDGNRGVRPNVLIFDYKNDYRAPDFVEAVGARIISPFDIPLNLFDTAGAAQSRTAWLDRFRFFSDILSKIYRGIGPVQQKNLKDAVKAAYANALTATPTIYDVYEQYELITTGRADSVTSILSDLVDMGLFEQDQSKLVAPKDFLSGIVVISLSELGQDDKTKNMLVAIMLNVFYEHMLKLPKRPFLGAKRDRRVIDSMLLVDEADNIMQYEFDVLRKILLQGREFGVGVILASQYLSHFKVGATDYREPLPGWPPQIPPPVAGSTSSRPGLGGFSSFLNDGCSASEARQAGGERRGAVGKPRTPQGPSTGLSCGRVACPRRAGVSVRRRLDSEALSRLLQPVALALELQQP